MPGETLSSALGQLREQIEKDEGASLDPLDKHNGVLIRSAIDLRRIVVESDRHLSTPINGEDLQQSGQPGPKLNPGDTLRFPSKPVRVNVSGQVSAPGPIYLYNNDTLELALVEAGGPLSSASTASATLIRKGQEIPLPLAGASLQQAPQNGDTIVVRPAPHVTVVGQVSTPGEYTLRNGSTLLNALYLSGGPTKWANVKYIEVVHGANREHFDLTGLQHGDLSSNVPLSDGDVVYVPEGHRIDASLFFQAIVGVLAASYDAGHL
jgi:protein involved in polysaccharide export with SLBB domain